MDVTEKRPLPAPTLDRWQPLRGGLLNLYLYQDEEFVYEHGRLLLRGNNGTGKSRVLALQLPFLLDGEVSPARVEPDGDPAKRMEWNLLMGGKHPDRVGYTWLELGRLDEKGESVFRTIGIGLQAVQGRGAPDRWYFITDQRIRRDLQLASDANTPLTRQRLEELLEGRGVVYRRAAEYREALDRTFFSLGPERYRALVDLLIQLRKPQLSRKLDEKDLSRALSNALPPIDDAVIGDVAEAFRELEVYREDLEGFREASKAVETFLGGYRRYLKIVSRQRAESVRRGHSQYEACMRELRSAERERDEARQRLREIGLRIDELESEEASARAERDALRDSREMRDARELEWAAENLRSRKEALEDACRDREHAEEELQTRADELERAEAEARGVMSESGRCLEACASRAAEAELVSLWNEVTARLDPNEGVEVDDIERASQRSQNETRERLGQADHLQRRTDELRGLQQALEGALGARNKLSDELELAREASAQAESTRGDAQKALQSSASHWAGGLEVLPRPDLDDLRDAIEAWADSGEGQGPVSEAAARAHEKAMRVLADEGTGLRENERQVEAQLTELREERDRLVSGRHEPPPTPHTRDAEERDERRGAPLWKLCEFRLDVSDQQRAGFEAALEAAGILDAWISPEGELLAEGVHDALLRARENPARGSSLADVLEPSIDDGDPKTVDIRRHTVGKILEGIAVEEEGEVWVLSDGRYRIGPVEGAWSKPAAVHIGHAARQAERRRRLAELALSVTEAEDELQRAREALEVHAERRKRADEERREAPSEEPLRSAIGQLLLAGRIVHDLAGRVAAADAEVVSAREARDSARERLVLEAEELGLAHRLDDLKGLSDRIREYENAAASLWPTLKAWVKAARHARQRSTAVEHAETLSREKSERHRAAERDVEAARTRLAVLETTIGAAVREVLARLDEVVGRLEKTRRDRESEVNRKQGFANVEGKAMGLIEGLERQRADHAALRDTAATALQALARTRLLGDLDASFAEIHDEDDWSVSRAVEVARRIEQLLQNVDAGAVAAERSRTELHRRIRDLENQLLPMSYRPVTVDRDGIVAVTVTFQGGERTIGELWNMFVHEVAERGRILDAREREVIENHLIDEVSAHLHDLIRRGDELVARMNAEIESRPMSTGMQLRFHWKPNADEPEGFVAARKKLLASRGTWSPAAREAVGEFLHRRIKAEREARDSGPWRELLARAFDYRTWHRFMVARKQQGQWQLLTRRTHGTGSGGEKAIALTVPQLAAAAAHYQSAGEHAPRLILLDEAFVGIDSDMRGKCMELLAAFDLDFVMTSEREWGCYAGLPGLAIYQLTARPGFEAVHTTRWVWNGRERSLDGDGLTSGAAAW